MNEAEAEALSWSVDHVGVLVPDLDEALDLFVGRLGWELSEQGTAGGQVRFAFVRLGAVELEIAESGDVAMGTLDHLGFGVADLERASESLEAVGVGRRGGVVDGARAPAQRLDPSTTLGIRCHLSLNGSGTSAP